MLIFLFLYIYITHITHIYYILIFKNLDCDLHKRKFY